MARGVAQLSANSRRRELSVADIFFVSKLQRSQHSHLLHVSIRADVLAVAIELPR
jgi:hypothetical protein